jgi:putative endonuclease
LHYHQQTGATGETLAVTWLEEKGYTILERNWRHKRCEVDIIAGKNSRLHIVEIKTRTSAAFGLPEEHINRTEMNCMKQAALAYQAATNQWIYLQFDVLSICLYPNQPIEYFLIEDIFF